MSLDTVALVIELERYFHISIPDAETEKMFTIRDTVDSIARLMRIDAEESTFQLNLLQQINAAFKARRVSLFSAA